MTRKFCSSLIIAPLLLSVLASCDQQPKTKPAESADAQKPKKNSLGSPDTRFTEERSAMIDGKFQEAADALAETATIPKIREPLFSWIQFHEGMALLLVGNDEKAREVFGQIEDRGPFTKKGPQVPMADFLVKVAHQMRGTEPISATVSKEYDKWSYQGIAYLALGLKDWNLDKLDDAVALFRQFKDVTPEKQVDWADGPADLNKLKEIADNFANDYIEFTPARKALDDVADKSIEEQRDAVEEAKKARANMKLTTKLSKSLDETLADLGPKVASAMAAKEKAAADIIENDEKMLADAKEKRTDMLSKFQFTEAHSAIADPSFKTEKARTEQELLAKKAQWLSNFKAQLIEDLNKKGYAQPITRKSGEAINGGVKQADEQQVMIAGPKGLAPVPWADISLDSDYDMALSFIPPTMPPEMASFRKWHLGVFAFYAGKTKEAHGLLKEAALVRPVLKDELPLFEKADGPY